MFPWVQKVHQESDLLALLALWCFKKEYASTGAGKPSLLPFLQGGKLNANKAFLLRKQVQGKANYFVWLKTGVTECWVQCQRRTANNCA